MRSRRVCRDFTDERVERADIETIVEAARLASSAGNIRLHRFLVVQDQRRIALIQAVSPGMWVPPPALIVICTDLEVAAKAQVQVGKDHSVWIDVGTAAMNMMLAAHALGLGSSPATSFSPGGLRVVLELPEFATPEFILQIGHRAAEPTAQPARPSRRLEASDLTYWERYRVDSAADAGGPLTEMAGYPDSGLGG
ncbi:MAG: nitroreductase family protein [Candidatus Dormibacteria bacterium]